MDPDVVAMCQRVSRALWRRISRAHQSVIGPEDLEQEMLLAAWIQLEVDPETDLVLLSVICRRRAIDWMRQAGDLQRRDRATGERPVLDLVSLSDPVGSEDTTRGDLLSDPTSQEDYEDVENQLTLAAAFDTYQGAARTADVAWLGSQGVPLDEIGAHFGVTESRACQIRNRFIEDVQRAWDLPSPVRRTFAA